MEKFEKKHVILFVGYVVIGRSKIYLVQMKLGALFLAI
jgi:hypothetical protein